MKIRVLSILMLVMAICGACTTKSSGPSPLESQAVRLQAEFNKIAEGAPMLLDSVGVHYADGTLAVNIAYDADGVLPSDFNDALVQFVVAKYMKEHTGANLDEILNTLSKEEGKLALTLIADNQSATFDIPAARLINLLKLKPMEMNYSEARSALSNIMSGRCAFLAEDAKAESADFTIVGGFAQYTLTFANASSYKQLKQSQLAGRYVAKLTAIYADYGDCRPFIEDLLKSFDIEGYRFIYTDNSDKNTLKAAVLWKMIN